MSNTEFGIKGNFLGEPEDASQNGDQEALNKEEENQNNEPANPGNEEPTTTELNDDVVREYLAKKSNKEITSLDDLFKEPEVKEVEKVVSPFENLMDDEDKEYYKFKEETGGDREAFNFVKKDLETFSPLDLARQRVREENNQPKASNESIDAYLEKKLNIDLSEENLSDADLIELSGYSKPQYEKLKALQEKYKQPKPVEQNEPEMFELADGRKVTKEQYKKLEDDRNQYIEDVTNAVNSVTEFSFQTLINDDGEDQELTFNYELSKEDKHSMLSDSMDIDATIQKRFQTEKGFNHQGLAKAIWLSDEQNLNKVVSAAVKQAIASRTEQLIEEGNNETFKKLEKSGTENYDEYSLENAVKKTNQQGSSTFGVNIST